MQRKKLGKCIDFSGVLMGDVFGAYVNNFLEERKERSGMI
jgi:hypothetical protein